MILQKLPKITHIEGGESPLSSPEFVLDNYAVTAFLFENTDGSSLTVKVMANTEGGEPEAVPFLFKEANESEYENVEATGKILTDGGAFVAVVTADSFARYELDRVSITLECDEDLTAVYALQTQPRYENNE
jgi:hypothetical protein